MSLSTSALPVVEVELKEKGTPLHAACAVGDTVAETMTKNNRYYAAIPCFIISVVFAWRSFYKMRIRQGTSASRKKFEAHGAAANAACSLRLPCDVAYADRR